MKVLVTYYSWGGKTELVATSISKILGASIKKIEEVKQRKGFFGFLSGGYSAFKGKGSSIKPLDINFNDYDLIFLGTPVWASRPAPPINTFLSQADLTSKKIVLFVTMGGFGGEKTIEVMKEKIESKGGEVIASFMVKTGGKKPRDIVKEGEIIGRRFLDTGESKK